MIKAVFEKMFGGGGQGPMAAYNPSPPPLTPYGEYGA